VRTNVIASSLIVLSLSLLGLVVAQSQPRSAPVQQLRGLWVDAFGPGFKTPQEADALVAYARSLRLNALFLQVGRRMDCFCNRASVPRSADPKLARNFDPLEYVIQKAHAAGIQVHAWIITTSAFNTTEPAIASSHVMNTNGTRGADSWLTQTRDGTTLAGKDYILDPGHPAAANYIAAFYRSVVQNYDVDGIQFDRVRYPDSGDNAYRPVWGYNRTSLSRFQLETNRRDVPEPTDAAWSQWRRDQVTNLVRRVYLETKALKPHLWVSAATIVYKAAPRTVEEFRTRRTYAEVLQDWVSWMQSGVLDLNLPMNYKRETVPEQVQEFGGWTNFAVATRGAGSVGVGTAIYLNSLPDSLKQYARGVAVRGVSGWVGYSYRTPDAETFAGRKSTPTAQRELLRVFAGTPTAPFAGEAVWGRPDAQQLSGVIGRVTRDGAGLANASVELRGEDGSSILVRSDANGFYGAPNLPVGVVTVSALQNDAVAANLETETTLGRVVSVPDLVIRP
jgi:uncharacterized lipoprotein YddW (UPF0748 family)